MLRSLVVATIAAAALHVPRASASAALPEVTSCIPRLDPQLDIGYERIAARCPELVKQLEQGSWLPWLPRGWKEPGNDLSAGGLEELRNLIGREEAAHPGGPAPDVGKLNAVLSGLAVKSPDGRWSRFKSWVRSILERREEPADDSWFSRLTSQVGVPQSLRQIIAYTALAAVVLLAAAIIGNELRAAGLLPARAGSRRRGQAARIPGWSDAYLRDVEQGSIRDRPRLLLELIVRKLNERGILPPPGALTVRELTRSARFEEPGDRERLSDLALAAERVRFSAREPEAADLEAPVSRGRELLQRLDAGVP